MIITQLQAFLEILGSSPENIEFTDSMAVIDTHYRYQPADFDNAGISNPAGTNEGSCKIFAFAYLHGLSEQQTLACFGDYYRKHVLARPHGDDHANIRQFIKTGWPGIRFSRDDVLTRIDS